VVAADALGDLKKYPAANDRGEQLEVTAVDVLVVQATDPV
jgi:hypothetical protein